MSQLHFVNCENFQLIFCHWYFSQTDPVPWRRQGPWAQTWGKRNTPTRGTFWRIQIESCPSEVHQEDPGYCATGG